MNQQSNHVFQSSGLGIAPFTLSNASHPKAKANLSFFCEHCGTMLKNRFFVMSSDNIVSVVGIDCLKKTGDSGLINDAKECMKKEREDKKMARNAKVRENRLNTERALLNGRTRDDVIQECINNIEVQKQKFWKVIKKLPAYQMLMEGYAFGPSVIQSMINGLEVSDGATDIISAIITKHLSNGARKNSPEFCKSKLEAELLCKKLISLANKHREVINRIETSRIEALGALV